MRLNNNGSNINLNEEIKEEYEGIPKTKALDLSNEINIDELT
jgi:hypothetical protein